MSTLAEDLQKTKVSIQEFRDVTQRILNYIPDVLNVESEFGNYVICSSNIAGTTKSIRPFKKDLFIRREKDFDKDFKKFESIIKYLKSGKRNFEENDFHLIDSVTYTMQQAIGIGLDLMVHPNSARKLVGNRFEELIRIIFTILGISIKKVVLSIPYETEEGNKYYRCETDVIISPYDKVRSDSKTINQNEIVITLKTTTKDRMPKIFIDKVLMEKFVGHPVKIVGISQNDIQRKDDGEIPKISYTFVSNLFMVYTKFLAQLEGYYYLDPPARALEKPYNQYIFPFSKFILEDLWKMLRS
jgi:hypothetical protein